MAYSKDEIRQMCETAIQCPEEFYKKKFVNFRGYAKNSKDLYTDIVAEFLLEPNNLKALKGIAEIERESSYYVKGHDGNYCSEKKNMDDEEILAKKLFKQRDKDFPFEIIDYQTPLKNKRGDKGVGKIDLLAVDRKESIIYILELKKKRNTETMLRCILEAYTYAKIVNKRKLVEDFAEAGKLDKAKVADYKLRIAPLIFVDGTQRDEMNELARGNRDCLKKIIEELGKDEKWGEEYIVEPFYIDEKDDKFVISKI